VLKNSILKIAFWALRISSQVS